VDGHWKIMSTVFHIHCSPSNQAVWVSYDLP
jgi:hypothetical protein